MKLADHVAVRFPCRLEMTPKAGGDHPSFHTKVGFVTLYLGALQTTGTNGDTWQLKTGKTRQVCSKSEATENLFHLLFLKNLRGNTFFLQHVSHFGFFDEILCWIHLEPTPLGLQQIRAPNHPSSKEPRNSGLISNLTLPTSAGRTPEIGYQGERRIWPKKVVILNLLKRLAPQVAEIVRQNLRRVREALEQEPGLRASGRVHAFDSTKTSACDCRYPEHPILIRINGNR